MGGIDPASQGRHDKSKLCQQAETGPKHIVLCEQVPFAISLQKDQGGEPPEQDPEKVYADQPQQGDDNRLVLFPRVVPDRDIGIAILIMYHEALPRLSVRRRKIDAQRQLIRIVMSRNDMEITLHIEA